MPDRSDKALSALIEFVDRCSRLAVPDAHMADRILIGKLVARLPEDMAAEVINQVIEQIVCQFEVTPKQRWRN